VRELFSRLYGNLSVKERLAAAITSGTLPHALLITGPDGSGKKTLALEIMLALNCENKGNESFPLPCGKCNTCRRIREGNYTDVTRLSRHKDKATIGVEEVRDFRESMFLSATESSFKLYVIEEADKLTVNAQNALLKVLEEPPKSVIIILIAESQDKILTTIKSRAQSISMEYFSPDAITAYLVKNNDRANALSRTNLAALDGIVMSADGRIGRALELLSEKDAGENAEDRRLALDVVEKMKPSVAYSGLYTALSSLPSAREDFREALELIINALRDLILIKQSSKAPLLFFTDRERAKNLSRNITLKRLLSLYDFTRGALDDATKNVSVGTIISDLGVKIKLI